MACKSTIAMADGVAAAETTRRTGIKPGPAMSSARGRAPVIGKLTLRKQYNFQILFVAAPPGAPPAPSPPAARTVDALDPNAGLLAPKREATDKKPVSDAFSLRPQQVWSSLLLVALEAHCTDSDTQMSGSCCHCRHRRRKLLDLLAPHVTCVLCVLTACTCASSLHSMAGTNEVMVSRAAASRSLSEYGAAACDSYLNTHHQVWYHRGPATSSRAASGPRRVVRAAQRMWSRHPGMTRRGAVCPTNFACS